MGLIKVDNIRLVKPRITDVRMDKHVISVSSENDGIVRNYQPYLLNTSFCEFSSLNDLPMTFYQGTRSIITNQEWTDCGKALRCAGGSQINNRGFGFHVHDFNREIIVLFRTYSTGNIIGGILFGVSQYIIGDFGVESVTGYYLKISYSLNSISINRLNNTPLNGGPELASASLHKQASVLIENPIEITGKRMTGNTFSFTVRNKGEQLSTNIIATDPNPLPNGWNGIGGSSFSYAPHDFGSIQAK